MEIEPGVRDGMEYPFIGEGEMLVWIMITLALSLKYMAACYWGGSEGIAFPDRLNRDTA